MAAWCRAGIKDVVVAAIGVAILGPPLLSVDIIVTEGLAFFGRDVALELGVALPMMAAYAVLGRIYIAMSNFRRAAALGPWTLVLTTPDLRHAFLNIKDRLTRLEELLHLIAMANEGLDPPHAAAFARGLQLAQDQAGGIRKARHAAGMRCYLEGAVTPAHS